MLVWLNCSYFTLFHQKGSGCFTEAIRANAIQRNMQHTHKNIFYPGRSNCYRSPPTVMKCGWLLCCFYSSRFRENAGKPIFHPSFPPRSVSLYLLHSRRRRRRRLSSFLHVRLAQPWAAAGEEEKKIDCEMHRDCEVKRWACTKAIIGNS